MRQGWNILEAHERRSALRVLVVAVFAALSAAVMVGSVLPFLSVLGDPSKISDSTALSWGYDTFGFSSDYGFLIALGLLSLSVIVLANLMQMLRVYMVTRFSFMRMHSLSKRLLTTYLRQPYEFFIGNHSGELSTKVLSETQQIVNLFYRPATEVTASLLTVVAVVTLLLIVAPMIALTALALIGSIYGVIFLIAGRSVSRLGKTRMTANKARFRIASEILGAAKTIRLSGCELAFVDRFSGPSARMAITQAKVAVISQVPQYAIQAFAFGAIVVLCLVLMDPAEFASGQALGGMLPTLGLFALAGQRLIPELSRLYHSVTQLKYAGPAVSSVYEDLFTGTAVGSLSRQPSKPLGLRRELRLEHVNYGYPGADTASLQDITLSIRAGECIGIVGATGAGKTTLADIILALLQPASGRIVVDEVEITAANLKDWYQTVAYVPQDIFLVDATIQENIAFGIPAQTIDASKVRKAAKIAQMHEFITGKLVNGYDTVIGERGVRLSGGQRQRLGIARALYHDADLLMLDEATSALDNLTEAEVITSIKALHGDKTVLMVAHRLSTLRCCDRILVLDHGRLSGFDTWEVLLEDNPDFQAIAAAANLG